MDLRNSENSSPFRSSFKIVAAKFNSHRKIVLKLNKSVVFD